MLFNNAYVYITPHNTRQIKLPETTEVPHMMKNPDQPKEHPDYWIKEAIDQLLEPEMDHLITSKYFRKETHTNRTTKPPLEEKPAQISITITPQNFIKCFQKWKDFTASSPSGRHIGHYKILTSESDIVAYFYKIL